MTDYVLRNEEVMIWQKAWTVSISSLNLDDVQGSSWYTKHTVVIPISSLRNTLLRNHNLHCLSFIKRTSKLNISDPATFALWHFVYC